MSLHVLCVCVCVVSVIVKHPVLPPSVVDGLSRNPLNYYYYYYYYYYYVLCALEPSLPASVFVRPA